jgi:hypothetical protein
MATKRQFSFIAWCAASGICGALSATCGKEAPLTASPYMAALMYTAMLAVRASFIISLIIISHII